MSTEKSACEIQPPEPWPHGDSAKESAAPVAEYMSDLLVETCLDDLAEADQKQAMAMQLKAEADGIRKRVQNRVTKAMKLLPVDTFDLETRTVTRGGAAKVEP